ncbi:hypothetical protein ABZ738_24010 [Micromonospora sp. NPDC047793]|uniref:hypothetical protein n=1 Tax=Micromonospora sp. NPDC047793 TaxID=3154342 RepID=UPI0033D45402
MILVPGRSALVAQADVTGARPGCSFCPDGAEAPSARVALFESRHPMVQAMGGRARHHVLVYGDEHGQRLADVPLTDVVALLDTAGKQTTTLFDDPGVLAVYAFESVGDHFGPTVAHPHGQIIGLDFVPRRLLLLADACLLCATGSDDLIVQTTPGTYLRVAPWARLPFEMVLYPRRHLGRLADATATELLELAEQIQTGLALCRDSTGRNHPYLLNIMQAPRRNDGHQHHLRVEIVPLHKPDGNLKRPGAMEIGLGVYLNPVEPRNAAALLRERLAR